MAVVPPAVPVRQVVQDVHARLRQGAGAGPPPLNPRPCRPRTPDLITRPTQPPRFTLLATHAARVAHLSRHQRHEQQVGVSA